MKQQAKRKYTKHAISISAIKRVARQRADIAHNIAEVITDTEEYKQAELRAFYRGQAFALRRLVTDIDHYHTAFFQT